MNITDIAKQAGVSVSAVSRYLNNGYVSEEKRQQIKEVIDRTGYKPARQTRGLREKRSKVIGVIVPEISSEAISRVVDGITTFLSERGYKVVLATTANQRDCEIEYLTLFDQIQVAGIIFVATWFGKAHKTVLRKLSIPFVIVGQKYEKFPCVYNDDFNASRELTENMINAGCKHIGCLHITEKDEGAGFNRLKGFKRALNIHRVKANVEQYVETDSSIESGYAAMTELLENYPEVDGVFCATDEIAVGAMKRLKEENRRVPEDVKVVSIGHTRMSRVVSPILETAHLYYKNCGMESADILLKMVETGQMSDQQIMLGYKIIHGESL